MVPKMPRRAMPMDDCIAAPTGCHTARVPSDCLSLVGMLAALTIAALPLVASADAELNELVVTAQRQSERSQDVPIALTAISADELRDRGIRQAADITSLVPNMLLNLPWGPEAQPTFTLRGVTTTDYSQNQSSPIAMYVDEVYKSVGALQALQVFDLDRVEVLRGPQGTLYGKNATGGAVSFYSANPSLTSTDGYVEAGIGNYNDYSVRGAVGVPLLENKVAVRAAVYYEKRDGWTKSIAPGVDPLNGVDALAGRLTVIAQPVGDFTATLKLAVSRSSGTPYGPHALNNVPAVTGFAGNIDWFDTGSKYAVHKEIRNDSVSLKAEWGLADQLLLTSITGFDYGRWYTKSDDGGLPITARLDDPNSYFSSVNAFSEEIRLASRRSRSLQWLAGLYYGRESVHAIVQYHFFDGYPGSFVTPAGATLYGFDEYNNFDQIKESKAVFLNTTFEVVPTVTLHAGARCNKDNVAIRHFYALEGGPAVPPVGLTPDGLTAAYWTQTIGALPATFTNYQKSLAAPGPTLNRDEDNTNVSFRAGADWKASDAILAYLNFSQGYRGAAFNGQAFNAPAELNFAAPSDIFTAYFKLSLIGGLLISAPMMFYQLWSFIAPGLYKKEKKFVIPFVFFSTVLFVGGGLFGWRVAFPVTFSYFLELAGKSGTMIVRPVVMVPQYLDFVSQMLLAFGIVFELPLFILFLSIAGIVNYLQLLRFGRWFILVAFTVGAIITPPDTTSQLVMSIPLCGLYFVSIGLAYLFGKRPSKEAIAKDRAERAAKKRAKTLEREAKKRKKAGQ